MKEKGFLLVEVLVAAALLSLAAGGVHAGFSQAVRINRAIHETDGLYDPFKILWMRTAKDLRNTVSLRNYKFIGKQEEMTFPVFAATPRLLLVRYFVKKGVLIRSEKKLPEKFVKESPHEEILIQRVEKARFEYAYLDKEEKLVFKPFWLEEPYFGIPKAVRMQVKLKNKDKVFSRLVPIPQGRWGHE